MNLAPYHNLSVREGERKDVNVCEYLLQSFKGTVHPTIKQVCPLILFMGLHPSRLDVNRSVLVPSAFSPAFE